MDQTQSQSKRPSIRRDGWTAARQLNFLGELARTRSVTRAARAVGMSRESAYRLRSRSESALFAAAWDRAMESHKMVNFAGAPAEGISVDRVARHVQLRDLRSGQGNRRRFIAIR
jgi:hypothetical protein